MAEMRLESRSVRESAQAYTHTHTHDLRVSGWPSSSSVPWVAMGGQAIDQTHYYQTRGCLSCCLPSAGSLLSLMERSAAFSPAPVLVTPAP